MPLVLAFRLNSYGARREGASALFTVIWLHPALQAASYEFSLNINHKKAGKSSHLLQKCWLADKFKGPWKRRRELNRLSTWVRERKSSLLCTFFALSGVP